MNRKALLLLLSALMLVLASRLPAPISEVETPTPAKKAKAKSKEHTEKTKVENRSASTPQPTAKKDTLFAGTWSGTLNWGIGGNYDHTIVIDAAQKTASVTNCESGTVFPTSIGADAISWVTGNFHEHRWTLKPFPDGKSAVVTINGHNSAVFRRVN